MIYEVIPGWSLTLMAPTDPQRKNEGIDRENRKIVSIHRLHIMGFPKLVSFLAFAAMVMIIGTPTAAFLHPIHPLPRPAKCTSFHLPAHVKGSDDDRNPKRSRFLARIKRVARPITAPLAPLAQVKSRMKANHPQKYKLSKLLFVVSFFFSLYPMLTYFMRQSYLLKVQSGAIVATSSLTMAEAMRMTPSIQIPFSEFYDRLTIGGGFGSETKNFIFDVVARNGRFDITRIPKDKTLFGRNDIKRWYTLVPTSIDSTLVLPLLEATKRNTLKNVMIRSGPPLPKTAAQKMLMLAQNMIPALYIYWLYRIFKANMPGNGEKDKVGKIARESLLSDPANRVYFRDVEGIDNAKFSIMELVDTIRDPLKYSRVGARAPKGLLMVGPPGTGKTMLAKATATEAGVPIIYCSGSDFVEMFVGRGAARVRKIFQQAARVAPCIVFVDELDAVGKSRDRPFQSNNDEADQTLNQLLASMDGLEGLEGVVIMAATNRFDILDPALTRPGRFDRIVRVELPDVVGREKILRIHGQKLIASETIDYKLFASLLPNACGADLAGIANEAGISAARDAAAGVRNSDFERAVAEFYQSRRRSGALDQMLKKILPQNKKN